MGQVFDTSFQESLRSDDPLPFPPEVRHQSLMLLGNNHGKINQDLRAATEEQTQA